LAGVWPTGCVAVECQSCCAASLALSTLADCCWHWLLLFSRSCCARASESCKCTSEVELWSALARALDARASAALSVSILALSVSIFAVQAPRAVLYYRTTHHVVCGKGRPTQAPACLDSWLLHCITKRGKTVASARQDCSCCSLARVGYSIWGGSPQG
jgi:hypothetical protein